MNPFTKSIAAPIDSADDENVLAEHGYKQELNRSWGLLQNFGVSFSIIVCRPSRLHDLPLGVLDDLTHNTERDYGYNDIV